MMAVAAARVAASGHPLALAALAFWACQIALNTLWTPVFFGLRRMRAGLVVIALLWWAVAATLALSARADAIAGWLLAPYLLWVSYAAALNLALLRRNPDAAAVR